MFFYLLAGVPGGTSLGLTWVSDCFQRVLVVHSLNLLFLSSKCLKSKHFFLSDASSEEIGTKSSQPLATVKGVNRAVYIFHLYRFSICNPLRNTEESRPLHRYLLARLFKPVSEHRYRHGTLMQESSAHLQGQ